MRKKYTPEYLVERLGNDLREEMRKCSCKDCQRISEYTPPSREWINNHGYSGIHKAIKREFGETTKEFLEKEGGFRETSGWPGDHKETHRKIELFLSEVCADEQSRGEAESTVNSRRTHLRKVLRCLKNTHNSCNLIKHGSNDISGFLCMSDAFDLLGEDIQPGARYNYAKTLQKFYDFLANRYSSVDHNPVKKILDERGWDSPQGDGNTIPLEPNQVKRAWEVAENLKEMSLLFIICGVGGRTGDVARLRTGDIYLDDDPRIDYDEERSKRGESVMLPKCGGKKALRLYIQRLKKSNEDWLFASNRGHVTPDTIRNRFKTIMRRAEIRIIDDDEKSIPTPENGRNYKHEQTKDVEKQWKEIIKKTTEQMDKSNPEITWNHYLEDRGRREFIRSKTSERFSSVMPKESIDFVEFEEDQGRKYYTLDDIC